MARQELFQQRSSLLPTFGNQENGGGFNITEGQQAGKTYASEEYIRATIRDDLLRYIPPEDMKRLAKESASPALSELFVSQEVKGVNRWLIENIGGATYFSRSFLSWLLNLPVNTAKLIWKGMPPNAWYIIANKKMWSVITNPTKWGQGELGSWDIEISPGFVERGGYKNVLKQRIDGGKDFEALFLPAGPINIVQDRPLSVGTMPEIQGGAQLEFYDVSKLQVAIGNLDVAYNVKKPTHPRNFNLEDHLVSFTYDGLCKFIPAAVQLIVQKKLSNEEKRALLEDGEYPWDRWLVMGEYRSYWFDREQHERINKLKGNFNKIESVEDAIGLAEQRNGVGVVNITLDIGPDKISLAKAAAHHQKIIAEKLGEADAKRSLASARGRLKAADELQKEFPNASRQTIDGLIYPQGSAFHVNLGGMDPKSQIFTDIAGKIINDRTSTNSRNRTDIKFPLARKDYQQEISDFIQGGITNPRDLLQKIVQLRGKNLTPEQYQLVRSFLNKKESKQVLRIGGDEELRTLSHAINNIIKS